MPRICFPSCFFVKYEADPPLSAVSGVGLRTIPRPGVLARLIADKGFGVRDDEAVAEWKE